MKLYDSYGAPNPKRLRMYLAEKDIKIETVSIDLIQGEQRSDTFRRKNPMCGVPVLELDDGSCYSESMAIIEYFEELHPELLQPIAGILQASHPFFAGERPTIADLTAYASLEFASMMGHPVDLGRRPNVGRWFESFSKRPSASA